MPHGCILKSPTDLTTKHPIQGRGRLTLWLSLLLSMQSSQPSDEGPEPQERGSHSPSPFGLKEQNRKLLLVVWEGKLWSLYEAWSLHESTECISSNILEIILSNFLLLTSSRLHLRTTQCSLTNKKQRGLFWATSPVNHFHPQFSKPSAFFKITDI